MKFIVDELPYYHEECILSPLCGEFEGVCCPRTWSKYKVSDDNPRECKYLIE